MEIRNSPDTCTIKGAERILYRERTRIRDECDPQPTHTASLSSIPPFLETPVIEVVAVDRVAVGMRRRCRQCIAPETRHPLRQLHCRGPSPDAAELTLLHPTAPHPRYAGGRGAWPLSKAHNKIGDPCWQTALREIARGKSTRATGRPLRVETKIRHGRQIR